MIDRTRPPIIPEELWNSYLALHDIEQLMKEHERVKALNPADLRQNTVNREIMNGVTRIYQTIARGLRKKIKTEYAYLKAALPRKYKDGHELVEWLNSLEAGEKNEYHYADPDNSE